MYPDERIDKFIELRARGWSLGHIATDLDVSKRTLVDWNREHAKEVQSVHALELELLKEKIIASREEQLDHLHRLQKDIADELGSRRLKYIETEDLFRLSLDLRGEIERLHHLKDSDEESSSPSPNGLARSTTPVNNGTA